MKRIISILVFVLSLPIVHGQEDQAKDAIIAFIEESLNSQSEKEVTKVVGLSDSLTGRLLFTHLPFDSLGNYDLPRFKVYLAGEEIVRITSEQTEGNQHHIYHFVDQKLVKEVASCRMAIYRSVDQRSNGCFGEYSSRYSIYYHEESFYQGFRIDQNRECSCAPYILPSFIGKQLETTLQEIEGFVLNHEEK